MRVGIIDLLGKEPPTNGYSRFMRANNTSIMAQVTGVWCAAEGHDVHIAYYSGHALIAGGLPDDVDIIFISAFSQAALVAYAWSRYFQDRGAVTVLGGPHARSYPEDARRYFDYVIGFCNRGLIGDVLRDASPHRPLGQHLTASGQPAQLPGLRERWRFLRPAMEQAKILRAVPLLGSLGCPYTCSFCIDATVPYQPLDFEQLKDDLRFFRESALPRSILVWHDPNFGIRFNDYLDAMEEAVSPGSVISACETSLSLLTEERLRRLKRNGFRVIAPGIESWYEMGDKSKVRSITGLEKVHRVADHVNLVQSYVNYTQTNLIFGLDSDAGAEPFELTRQFIDRAPGAYPHFALLSAFGRNAALNRQYQHEGRVIGVPFHFLDLQQAMNVRPKHYTWTEFYDRVCETWSYAFSPRVMARRFRHNRSIVPRVEQLFRGFSAEHRNRLAHQRKMRRWIEDRDVRAFFDGDTATVPTRFCDIIERHLGPLWQWLPPDALSHDPNTFVSSAA